MCNWRQFSRNSWFYGSWQALSATPWPVLRLDFRLSAGSTALEPGVAALNAPRRLPPNSAASGAAKASFGGGALYPNAIGPSSAPEQGAVTAAHPPSHTHPPACPPATKSRVPDDADAGDAGFHPFSGRVVVRERDGRRLLDQQILNGKGKKKDKKKISVRLRRILPLAVVSFSPSHRHILLPYHRPSLINSPPSLPPRRRPAVDPTLDPLTHVDLRLEVHPTSPECDQTVTIADRVRVFTRFSCDPTKTASNVETVPHLQHILCRLPYPSPRQLL